MSDETLGAQDDDFGCSATTTDTTGTAFGLFAVLMDLWPK